MKALSRKCTAFLLSLTLLLTLAPTALASEALGDDLDLRSTSTRPRMPSRSTARRSAR